MQRGERGRRLDLAPAAQRRTRLLSATERCGRQAAAALAGLSCQATARDPGYRRAMSSQRSLPCRGRPPRLCRPPRWRPARESSGVVPSASASPIPRLKSLHVPAAASTMRQLQADTRGGAPAPDRPTGRRGRHTLHGGTRRAGASPALRQAKLLPLCTARRGVELCAQALAVGHQQRVAVQAARVHVRFAIPVGRRNSAAARIDWTDALSKAISARVQVVAQRLAVALQRVLLAEIEQNRAGIDADGFGGARRRRGRGRCLRRRRWLRRALGGGSSGGLSLRDRVGRWH